MTLKVKLRDFFERERGGLPDGALVLRTLNNHDTVIEEGRVQQRFGAGLARALYGVCLISRSADDVSGGGAGLARSGVVG